MKQMLEDYKESHKRLILLDYDGSLVPFAIDYTSTSPPKAALDLLYKLQEEKSNDLVLVSGRNEFDLQRWFGKLNINLVGEHGAVSKKANEQLWKTNEQSENQWKNAVLPILDQYAELTPGARVEVKSHSVVWHYRNASPYYAQKHIVIIKRLLRPILHTYGLELSRGNKILEIKDPRINKGWVATQWLKDEYDFVLAIGDDLTDEDLFRVLPSGSYSIKVGRGSTAAAYRLPDYKAVRATLKKLTR